MTESAGKLLHHRTVFDGWRSISIVAPAVPRRGGHAANGYSSV